MTRPFALVGHPREMAFLSSFMDRHAPACLINPFRGRLPDTRAPVYLRSGEAVEQHTPALVAFLSPYADMGKDAETCLQRGIEVAVAGPVPCSPERYRALSAHGARFHVMSWTACHPQHRRLLQEIRQPDFGQPVYYRQITPGGSGMLRGWWAILRAWQMAVDAFGEEGTTHYVTAHRIKNACHISLTMRTPGGANAHLICTPSLAGADGDFLMLGTGGMITCASGPNLPGIYRSTGVYTPVPEDPHPLCLWLEAVMEGTAAPHPSPDIHAFAQRMRRAIHRAMRTHRSIPVEGPGFRVWKPP